MLSLSLRNECYRYPHVTELCSIEMVYDNTLIYQQTLCFFTAVFGSGFRLTLQSVAMMAMIEQSLLEELRASDQSSCSDDDDSSGTIDLTVVEVIVSECSDKESEDVQCATASSAPNASTATFTWEDMMNYVGQREQFFDNYGPQNEAQNETHCPKVFKMFVDDELAELIVHETNTYAAQKIQDRSFIPLRSLKTDCVGTLRLSRKDVPQRVKEKKPKKGELVAQHSGPVSVLKCKDKKDVTMISTYHGEETRMKLMKCRQEKQKPVSVLD